MKNVSLAKIEQKKEFLKFIVAGGTAALVNFGLFYFLTDLFGFWYLLSSVFSFMASFFVSFFLQKFWTFKDKNKAALPGQMKLYLLMAFLNLIFNAAAMYALVDIFRIWSLLSQLLVIAIISAWNFITYKFFIFNQDPPAHNQPLKILIATGIYPPDVGGPATLLMRLPVALEEKGLAIKVVTYSDVGLSDQERQGGKLYRVSRQAGPVFSWLAYFWRLWRLSRWADIIYATDTYSVGYFAYLIKKLTGKKYIIRFAGDSAWEVAAAKGWTHDYIVDFQRKTYNYRTEKLKQRRTKILTSADRVIAVSGFIASLAETIGVAKGKIRIIYNSVDFFGKRDEKQEPLSPALVFAGRLAPWKGVEMLLRVVAKLKGRWPKIILEILGDGPEEQRLKSLAKELNLGESVKFFGRVSEKGSHAVFARSTVFVLNSNYEGLPHSVLNAMAAGLPVVTTDIGGNQEVVEDGVNGLLVPYNDEAAWLEAISRLLTEKETRDKFIQNGYKVLAKFNWDKLVEETIKVFNDLAG